MTPRLGTLSQIATTRSSSGNGSGFSRSALMVLKIVVLAPMPRARVATAMRVKAGRLKRFLIAYRASLRRFSIIGSFSSVQPLCFSVSLWCVVFEIHQPQSDRGHRGCTELIRDDCQQRGVVVEV